MGEGWGHLVLSRLLSAVVLLAIASSSSFSFAGWLCVDASTSRPLPPLVHCRRPHHRLFLLFLGRSIHSIDVAAVVVFVTAAAVANVTVAVAVAAATTIAATKAAFFTAFVITATTVNTTFAATAIAAALPSSLVAVVDVAATSLSLSPPALPPHQPSPLPAPPLPLSPRHRPSNLLSTPFSVIYCTLQRVHARHRCRAVLQPNDGGAERLLRQAHRVAPRAGERGQGQIGRVGGINNNKGNDDDTRTQQSHSKHIIAHQMPNIVLFASSCRSHPTAC